MTYSIETRNGLPTEMQTLLTDYPREAWPDNPHFAASIQQWMGAHQMFRQLADIVTKDTERLIDKQRDPQDYAARLGHFGNLLVVNLHGHHTWEDRSYFPELLAADDRFETGLEMLEADHQVLDSGLDALTRSANRAIKLQQMDESQMREEAAHVLNNVTDLARYLSRHLPDEEDLVVPILLHHKMRG